MMSECIERDVLSVETEDWLERVSRSRVEAVRLSERALIVLLRQAGSPIVKSG